MLGCIIAYLAKRLPWGIGLLPVLVIFGWHLRTVPVFLKFSRDGGEYKQKIERFALLLDEYGLKDIYAPYPARESGHALNFMLDERFLFSDPRGERYEPYRRGIELSRSVAVLNNLYDVTDFLEATGAGAEFGGIDKLRVHYNFKPPSRQLVELELQVVDDLGNDVGGVISDADSTTAWISHPNDGQADMLEFHLDSPQSIHALRLYSATGLYAHDMRIEWLSENGEWCKSSDVMAKYNSYFWSGERFYFRSDYYRQEFRFEPVTTTSIRLYIDSQDKHPCELSELRLYGGTLQDGPVERGDDAVLAEIERLGLEQVYADRWMANRIHEKFDGEVATTINKRVSKSDKVRLDSEMRWTKKTGMLVPNSMKGSCEKSIEAAGFQMSKIDFDGVSLYYFGEGDWITYYAENRSFVWTGLGCLKQSNRSWAVYLKKHANHLKQSGSSSDALQVLEEAISVFPALPDGIDTLISWFQEQGDSESVLQWQREKEKMICEMTPGHSVSVKFGSKLHFKGLTLNEERVVAGDSVDIYYFWECSDLIVSTDWAVFVHFVGDDGDVAFQDDHVLLENESVDDQPVPVLFREHRQFVVPDGINSGSYRIRIGVYGRADNGGRLPVKSEYSGIGRCANLPVTLSVGD